MPRKPQLKERRLNARREDAPSGEIQYHLLEGPRRFGKLRLEESGDWRYWDVEDEDRGRIIRGALRNMAKGATIRERFRVIKSIYSRSCDRIEADFVHNKKDSD